MDDETKDRAEQRELEALTAKLRIAIRCSLAQSLVGYFPPPVEQPPELRALLERLDDV
jgi:hypothetical protein